MESGVAEVRDRGAAPAAAARPRRRAAAIATGVTLVAVLDQLTKAWALTALDDGPIGLIGHVVELRLSFNSGMAFGAFQGYTPLLAVAAIVVTVYLVRAVRRTTDTATVVGLVLVLGGAIGNLVDRAARADGRLLSGHVVDFISVGWWPVFNLADSAITVGALLLVWRGWRGHV